jgi:filamentous hemagglutinin family protein
MNHAYRLVWNAVQRRYVPAPEIAKGRGKNTGRSLRRSTVVMALGTSLLSLGALASPAGGSVTAGSGSISQSGSNTTITQGSQNLAINWASFSTTAGESVNFVQPNTSAIALNRVTGAQSSVLNGSLSANGQVWILNPNGVLFGSTANVNVGGLVASTLSLSDADFLAGKRSFTGDGSQGSVVNQGSLTGGYLALLGKQVRNTGSITTASVGTAVLAAGDKITLDFSGNQLLSVQVDEGTLNALAENKGLIRADNGTVILTASAKEALLDTVVNNEGVIEAKGIDSSGGTILLLGGMNGGTVKVAGTLDASANGAHNGGFIETSGAHVQVADGARISTLSDIGKTGTWLIDPTDFTITSGSGAQTTSGMGATTLSNNLANNNISLTTANSTGGDSGDINVNATVTWSANTILTLNAYNNINVNAAITATGASAGLALNYGDDYAIAAPITLSGASASLSMNGTAYTLVHNMTDLNGINSAGLNGHYALAQDLDASGTTYTGALIVGAFSGTFAGLGHTINNLTISAASTDSYIGLFMGNSGTIRDLGLVGGSVSGGAYVGELVGLNQGSINNVYATGNVAGAAYSVGGLVGMNDTAGSIRNAYTTGGVAGIGEAVGGLAGDNRGSISNAYASGGVSGVSNKVGGLVGWNASGGHISNVYATGSVDGSNLEVGGLVGWNDGTISNAYATGNVSGYSYVGGLAGINYGQGSINSAYATGSVSGSYNFGGLVGYNAGSISNAYWDNTTSGINWAVGSGSGTSNVSAVTSSTAYNHSSYTNLGTWTETASNSGVWVATSGGNKLWVMVEGSTRPFLYSEYATSIHNAHQLQLMAYDLAASYTLSANIDASETLGSNASGMWTTSGFSPVGNYAVAFSGSLDGQSHTITDLTINRSSTDNVGLFGETSSTSSISNLGLVGGSVSGATSVGTLVGLNWGLVSNANATTGNVSGTATAVGALVGWNASSGSISNAYATSSVSGNDVVGGLVGANFGGSISNAYATGNVSGNTRVGGLVGNNLGSISNAYAISTVSGNGDYVGGLVGENYSGTVSNAYANGNVSSSGDYTGGLVGVNTIGASISNAHATGNVSGSNNVGGLVGGNSGTINNAYAIGSVAGDGYGFGGLVGLNNGTISNVYATGNVAGTYSDLVFDFGGLVGDNYGGTISNAYATGSVSGHGFVGGLVGHNDGGGSIINAYVTGSVSGLDNVGALVGSNDGGTVTASFWLNSVSTTGIRFQNGSIDGYTRGLSASEASSASTYTAAGWDVAAAGGSSSVWRIYDGSSMPLLRSFLTSLTVTTGNTSKTYDGTTSLSDSYTLSNGNADTSLILGTASYRTSSKNVGSYSVGTSGLYSAQQGYDISYANGTADITRASLTIKANNASKTADGAAYSGGNGVSYNGFVNGETSGALGGSLVYGGTAQGATAVGSYSIAVSGLSAGNYALTYVDGSLVVNAAAATTTTTTTAGNTQLTQVQQNLQAPQPGTALVTASALATDELSNNPQEDVTLASTATSRVLDVQSCGIRLPDGLVCH